jgi:iron complex transport system ATP-binding protein
LLEAADVRFAYRHDRRGRNGVAAPHVLDDVTIRVPPHAIVGVLGPNGSGKTTLLRLMSGALAPLSGHVHLDSVDITAMPRRQTAQRLAVVPQETTLAFDYSALEIVLMGRYPHLGAFRWRGQVRGRARGAPGRGTDALANRPFRTLSGAKSSASRSLGAGAARRRTGRRAASAARRPTASLDLHYQIEVASLPTPARGARHHHSFHTRSGITAALCTDVVLLSRPGDRRGRPEDVLTPASIASVFEVSEARPRASAMTSPLRRACRLSSVVRRGVPARARRSSARPHRLPGSPRAAFADNVAQIFFVARLPRALAAALVGATLAAAGVVFQGLLRNPLATPYTLGVSAGARSARWWPSRSGRPFPCLASPRQPDRRRAAVAVLPSHSQASGLSTTVLLLAGVTLNASSPR